jgi:hypothetical protein
VYEAMVISSLRCISHRPGLVLKLGLRCEIRDGPHWQGGVVRSDDMPLVGGAERGVLGVLCQDAPCFPWRFLVCYWANTGPAVLA